MAELTWAAGGLSSFSSKKTPSFSSHGCSCSSKHIYDDVFTHRKSSTFCSFEDDDYGEIFGSEKSENGSWVSPSSSIPIFELEPGFQQRGRPSRGGGAEGGIDYSGVFGGFGDDGFAVPDGKELFSQLEEESQDFVN